MRHSPATVLATEGPDGSGRRARGRKGPEGRAVHFVLGPLAFLLLTLAPVVVHADARGPFAFWGAVAELDDGDDHGGALALGTRYEIGRHFALGFDLGYGVLAGARDVQDRWWMIPTAAFVVPAGDLRLEIGAGVGAGATSGYTNFDAYARGPFDPTWSYQLVPTARAHAALSVALNDDCEGFVRVELAGAIVDGNTIGVRAPNPQRVGGDTMWMLLAVGVAIRP